MKHNLLQAGKIINTHGIGGEVKIQPWADAPEFLLEFECLYIDDVPVKLLSARVHKGCIIAVLEGVLSIDDAIAMKNKTVYIDKDTAKLEDGRYFVADLVGLRAIDFDSGEELGAVRDVLSLPAHNVYLIEGVREIMVPAVSEFVKEIDMDSGIIKIKLIEGM